MPAARDRRAVCIALTLAALGGCKKDEVVLVPFNAQDDSVEVYVGVDSVEDDPDCAEGVSCTDLHSLVEGAVIGTVTVDPAAGPVGTIHRLLAVVGDDWEDRIDRVSVEVSSRRGEGAFDLERDRANPGAWGLSLESLGTADEERVDTWTVLLWEGVPADEATAEQSQEES